MRNNGRKVAETEAKKKREAREDDSARKERFVLESYFLVRKDCVPLLGITQNSNTSSQYCTYRYARVHILLSVLIVKKKGGRISL